MKPSKNPNVLEAMELGEAAIRNYLEVSTKVIRGQADSSKLEEAKALYNENAAKVAVLKDKVLTQKPVDYNIALEFVIEITKEDVENCYAKELKKLDELRKDGESKVRAIKEALDNIKLRKNITKAEKAEEIKALKVELAKAKGVEKANKVEVKKLSKQAKAIILVYGKEHRRYIKAASAHEKEIAIKLHSSLMEQEKSDYESKVGELDEFSKKFFKFEHRSKISEIDRDLNETKALCKDNNHAAFITQHQAIKIAKNMKLNPAEKMQLSWENYKHKFKFKDWLLKNSLYFVILIFFIICCIIANSQGNPLLTMRTIETIFTQSSTKVFFSLGVAGLILLGGTDLSIGRMTGMAATFSCLALSQIAYETNIGKIDMAIPVAIAVVLGIFLCVFSTTLFSALAGFFTAKFKMHPFITTLSSQLLIYGLMMVCFSQVPAFTMNTGIKNAITGENGWRLILYAAIIVIIVWFIWNKTKFGKNMYAVGDNKEAAKVSGINVFATTMGVFILAGILYGLGGFLEGARIGNANPSTALGTELDAIAACVIGGISFSGGKGKVSGAVVGTIIFTTLTYCLTYIGLDINFQYIFKGVIILAAVCLDSLKLLKKQ